MTEDVLESYVCGKCMYLAAALHRQFGWEIQVALEDPDGEPYIGHAWCVEPISAFCADIDGTYPHDISGWIHPGAKLITGLDEAALRALTLTTGYCTLTEQEWESHVNDAQSVVTGYLAPKLAKART